MRSATRILAVGWIAASLACAPSMQPPQMTSGEVDGAVEGFGSEMIDELVGVRSDLTDLEYRLTKAATPMCGVTLPLAGVLVTRRGAFEHEGMKAAVSGQVGAAEELTIVHVVPRGSLARAELRAGDRILALDGEPVRTAEALAEYLFELKGSHPVRVKYERPGEGEREAEVHLDRTCPVRFGLATSAALIPWRTGLILEVPLGLMRYAESDGVLAVLLAHQLAHILFDQPDDGEFESEARADRRGLRIAAAAGYDVSGAASYWEEIAIEYPWRALPSRRGGRPRANRWRDVWRSYDSFPHHDIARRMEGIRKAAKSAGRRHSLGVSFVDE